MKCIVIGLKIDSHFITREVSEVLETAFDGDARREQAQYALKDCDSNHIIILSTDGDILDSFTVEDPVVNF
jgi:hypothetical protein